MYRVQGLGILPLVLENQMQKKMETEMELGAYGACAECDVGA